MLIKLVCYNLFLYPCLVLKSLELKCKFLFHSNEEAVSWFASFPHLQYSVLKVKKTSKEMSYHQTTQIARSTYNEAKTWMQRKKSSTPNIWKPTTCTRTVLTVQVYTWVWIHVWYTGCSGKHGRPGQPRSPERKVDQLQAWGGNQCKLGNKKRKKNLKPFMYTAVYIIVQDSR